MSIFLDETTKVIVQGATGAVGVSFSRTISQCFPGLIVAGVTPGRHGERVAGAPVYNFVADALRQHPDATLSLMCVPARFFREAAIEAIDAGIECLVAYVEGVPVHDTMVVIAHARRHHAVLLGPNTAGILSPGKGMAGELNVATNPTRPGRLGVVTKSGSIAVDVMELTVDIEGHSTIVCLGGDAVVGTSFSDVLLRFERDPGTAAVVMVGEVGGNDEDLAADVVRRMSKPVIAYISGHSAPPGQTMGHAGALITSRSETAAWKSLALRDAGALVADTLPGIAALVEDALRRPAA